MPKPSKASELRVVPVNIGSEHGADGQTLDGRETSMARAEHALDVMMSKVMAVLA